MSNYTRLTPSKTNQIAALKGGGLSIRAIAARLGGLARRLAESWRGTPWRAVPIAPYQLKGNIFCAVSARPDFELRGYVLVPLLKGQTPEQISGRLGKGIEIDVDLISIGAI